MAPCVSRSESRGVPCPNHGGRRPSAEFGAPSSNDSAPANPATDQQTKTGSCRFLPRQLPRQGQNHRVKQQSRYPENAIPENGANQVPTERSGQMLDESPKNTMAIQPITFPAMQGGGAFAFCFKPIAGQRPQRL